jgi:hypothetical protein
MAMFDADSFEQPRLCCLDAHDVDRLLVRLRAVHGEGGRPDIAPQLKANQNSPGQILISPRKQTPRVAASSRP